MNSLRETLKELPVMRKRSSALEEVIMRKNEKLKMTDGTAALS